MLGAQEQKSAAAHLTACITAEQEVVLQGLDGSAQEAGEHVRVIAHMDAVLQYQRELSNIVGDHAAIAMVAHAIRTLP